MAKKNHYLAPAHTHNGCIRTDLPLIVGKRARKKKLEQFLTPGQLLCIGKVYLATHDGLIRIK